MSKLKCPYNSRVAECKVGSCAGCEVFIHAITKASADLCPICGSDIPCDCERKLLCK